MPVFTPDDTWHDPETNLNLDEIMHGLEQDLVAAIEVENGNIGSEELVDHFFNYALIAEFEAEQLTSWP